MSEAGIAGWPAHVGRRELESCGSTNAEALALAPELDMPVWVLAHRQTAGRGRRGRPWEMPEGNFAASLALRPQGNPTDISLLSFVAALALADVVGDLCGPHARVGIKWPNDVLLDGGKLAGILLESSGSGGRIEALAVGIGVNLAHAPAMPDAAFEPVSLRETYGVEISPSEFLDRLAPRFAQWQDRLIREGFEPVREAVLSRAVRLGQEIDVQIGADRVRGRFEGIDKAGALILVTGQGRQLVQAGDVFFSEPNPSAS